MEHRASGIPAGVQYHQGHQGRSHRRFCGRVDDAEHPSLILMDVPTSPSTTLGPMTRARAKAIEDKVNSLLSELPLSSYESWLLPQEETLCVIRYLEEGHGIATFNGQGGKDPKHDGQEEELLWKLQASDVHSSSKSGTTSGHSSSKSGTATGGHSSSSNSAPSAVYGA